ncbi:MAG: SurA N-terminal domain-containing protein, partial [Nitrospirota bacterium]
MSKKFRVAVAACAAVLALAACAKKGEQAAGVNNNSPVLAVVNGKNITANDFKEEAAALNPYAINALKDPKNRQKFLENIEDKQLIVQKAEDMGMNKDPKLVA